MTINFTATIGNPMRLLMVTPRYLPETGGVENHVYQVASRLVKAGVQVTVLTTDRRGKLAPDENDRGIHIKRVRAYPGQRDYYFAPALYGYIQQPCWDLVHIQSYHTLVAPLAMLAARHAKLPYLLTFHGGGHSTRLRNSARGMQLSLLRPLLARAARLVTLAQFEAPYYSTRLRLPAERFALIPNGADLPKPLVNSNHKVAGTWIASVGRLERYKGHHRLIEALPAILRRVPDAHLWIAGTGPYETELRRLALSLGVQDRVLIQAVPSHDREQMAERLAGTSLVALLSDYETHPIAILEALALGRPALVADTSGLRELSEQGLVTKIPLNSTPDQVATAVVQQLQFPLLPRRIDLPSWDDCASGLLNLYSEILQVQH